MSSPIAVVAVLAFTFAPGAPIMEQASTGVRPFVITVVDEQTGRGVPLVELKTVNEIRYVTDSAGVVAFDEPGLMGQTVFFHVKSHGYEYPKDGFGSRGKALEVVEGGEATLKIKRLNVAERLYRVTGAGVYRDTVLAGRTAPTKRPLLNARVLGSDSVLNAVYRGKLRWFWGDTNRPGYPLGNFHTPGATSDLPGQGGLDPETGVDLTYLTAGDGFAAETAHLPGEGPTWISGVIAFPDRTGRERLFAGYAKIRPPMETYERGLVEFDPDKGRFEKVATFPLDAPVRAEGQAFLGVDDGVTYVYYAQPFPLVRVRAHVDDIKDITHYEAFTCFDTGARFAPGKDGPTAKIDLGRDGRPRYFWRANTSAIGPAEQAKLLKAGRLEAGDALLALRDAETGQPILAHYGSVHWNAHRRRWVLICVELGGKSSVLGEVWYAEADTPLGPWVYARKVLTHDKYSFYNPKQHPYFDKDGGRTIFFEGTYSFTFSGNTDPTPRYDYNQVMYKLDLSDPRLNLPVPVYARDDGTLATGAAHAKGDRPAFFALERPGEDTVPVQWVAAKEDGLAPLAGEKGATGRPLFHGLPADAKEPPRATLPLYQYVSGDGRPRVYTPDPSWPVAGFRRVGPPVCLVWPSPTSVRLPPSPTPKLAPVP
jgi:hypothetical protein